MPGHKVAPTRPRVLDAPPKLEVPVSEPAPLNVQLMPDSLHATQLLKPPSLPLRTTEVEKSAPQTGVSSDTSPGDPATVLSLSSNPERLREFLTVPPGNQLGTLPEGGSSGRLTGSSGQGDGGTGSGAGASGGRGNGNGTGGSGTGGNGAAGNASGGNGSGGNGSGGTGPGGNGPGGSGGSNVGSVGGGKASGGLLPEGNAASGGSGLRSAILAAAAATRIEHPAGGVFDVVVQSAGLESFPESAGVLSGKPIYSVYVRAGGSKDWILQYCVPAADETVAQQAGQVIRLGASSPVTAPYPVVTMRPPVKPRPGRHVMVHGFITTEGRFQDLKVLGTAETTEAEIVTGVLAQWKFRPATRDGSHVRVEMLLAIPAD